MSVFNIGGNELLSVFDRTGNEAETAYDIEGNIVFASWYDEISIEKYRDSTTGTAYYVITIPRTRTDGTVQYPFVYAPNGDGSGTMSTYEIVQRDGWYMGINAGYFDYTGSTFRPYGITIENSELIRADYSSFKANYPLVIDGSGVLGYAGTINSGVTAQDILNGGAVSSVLGLVPLVINGESSDVDSSHWASTERAQRQIIGQYFNGDYCVVTCEGRNYDSSPGFTVSEARTLCLSLGLKFAHMLDGGGSVETVIGDTQINTVYEGTTGRIVPTVIVFNGQDSFFVPNG